jgi:DNA replication protein DnaC
VESFEATNAEQRAVKHWLLAFQSGGMPGGRGILMLGNPGIGKTHLLTGILRFLVLERGLDCRYVDAFHLLEQLKATFEAKSGTSALMSEVTRIPILAIDELGKSRTSGWQAEVLDQIISHRYNQGLTTFATSNFGPRKNGANAPPGRSAGGADASSKWAQLAQRESLEDRIGARIYSRLMEMCKPFLINGDDRRLRDTSGSAR